MCGPNITTVFVLAFHAIQRVNFRMTLTSKNENILLEGFIYIINTSMPGVSSKAKNIYVKQF